MPPKENPLQIDIIILRAKGSYSNDPNACKGIQLIYYYASLIFKYEL